MITGWRGVASFRMMCMDYTVSIKHPPTTLLCSLHTFYGYACIQLPGCRKGLEGTPQITKAVTFAGAGRSGVEIYKGEWICVLLAASHSSVGWYVGPLVDVTWRPQGGLSLGNNSHRTPMDSLRALLSGTNHRFGCSALTPWWRWGVGAVLPLVDGGALLLPPETSPCLSFSLHTGGRGSAPAVRPHPLPSTPKSPTHAALGDSRASGSGLLPVWPQGGQLRE